MSGAMREAVKLAFFSVAASVMSIIGTPIEPHAIAPQFLALSAIFLGLASVFEAFGGMEAALGVES